jgi:DNA-directed RNA polymerase subunit H (RpoH/RPB5)
MNLNTISSLFKSREIILDQLHSIGYDVAPHRLNLEEFQTNSLDFQAVHMKTGATVHVLYSLKKMVNVDIGDIESIIRDPEFQRDRDSIMIIWKSDPSENVQESIRNWYIQRKIFITWQTIDRTQYNVLKHILVPRFELLPPTKDDSDTSSIDTRMTFGVDSVEDLLRIFRTKIDNLPTESRFSPPLMAKLIRPGQVVCYHRPSPTAMICPHWVLCV